jgi:hypothetical protein
MNRAHEVLAYRVGGAHSAAVAVSGVASTHKIVVAVVIVMLEAARRPTRRELRTLQRGVHLLAGAVVLAHVYAAPVLGAGFAAVVRWLVVPTLVLSGLVLWKWPRIRARLPGADSPWLTLHCHDRCRWSDCNQTPKTVLRGALELAVPR